MAKNLIEDDGFEPDDGFIADAPTAVADDGFEADDGFVPEGAAPKTILSAGDLEGLRQREAQEKVQVRNMQAAFQRIRQLAAMNPVSWTSKQLQDFYKKNPPKSVQEQAQANAALELKKKQEQKLTDSLLPPDLRKEKPVEIKAPARTENQSLTEAAFSQSDTAGRGLADLIEFGIRQKIPGFTIPQEMRKPLEDAAKASPAGQLAEAQSREESLVAAPVLEMLKKPDAMNALKSIAQAAAGQNRAQIGDIFRELGVEENTSAILGFLGSLLLPSNLAAGKAGLKSLPAKAAPVETKALEVASEMKPGKTLGVSQAIKETMPDVFPQSGAEIPFRPPLPEKEGFSANINLEKITSEDELQNIIKATSEKFKGKIDEQRRGIITQEETQFLADNLGVTPDHLKRVRTGRAFNAEELKATSDLLLSQTRKVREVADKIQAGDNSAATLLDFQKQLQAQALVQTKLAGAKAESGRALQIQRMLAREAPSELKAQQEMLRALGGQEITEDIAHRLSMIDPNDIPAVNKFIREVTKATTADKVYEYWLNSILSNPQTHVVNSLSNTLRAVLEIPLDLVQAGAELFRGKSRRAFFGQVPARVVGDLMGIKEGVRRAIYAFKEGIPAERAGQIETRVPAIKGQLGEIIRTPTRALTAEDEFFKAVNATGELYAQAYKTAVQEGRSGKALLNRVGEIIQNPAPEIIEAMKKKALETTFQEDLGKFGSTIYGWRRTPGMRYIIPFIRTPGNIFKEGFRFSPAGFIELGFKGVTKQTFDSRLASKATVGSVIASAFALHAMEGNVTGAAPKDEALRDAFYRSGKKPYSVKIGDQWVPFQRLEPINTPLALIADSYEKFKTGEDWGDLALQAIGFIAQNLSNRTFLSGLSNVVNAMTDPVRYAPGYLARLLGGLVPFSGATRFVEQMNDPTLRKPTKGDTGNDALDAGTFISESIQADVPGLSGNVRPRLNVFGEETKKEGRGFDALAPSKVKNDPVDQELERLGVAVSFTDPQTGTVRGVELTNDERFELQQRAGRRIKERLDELIGNPAFQSRDDEDKKGRIKKEVDGIQEEEKIIELGKALPRILKSENAKEFAVTQFPKLQKSLSGKERIILFRDKEAQRAWNEFQVLRRENEGLFKPKPGIVKV